MLNLGNLYIINTKNYSNIIKFQCINRREEFVNLYKNVIRNFKTENILTLFKLQKFDMNNLDNKQLELIDNFINDLKSLYIKIIIKSQELPQNKIQLINESIKYIKNITNNDINISDINLNLDELHLKSSIITTFSIEYKEHTYNVSLYKENLNLYWKLTPFNKSYFKLLVTHKENFDSIIYAIYDDETFRSEEEYLN